MLKFYIIDVKIVIDFINCVLFYIIVIEFFNFKNVILRRIFELKNVNMLILVKDDVVLRFLRGVSDDFFV